MIPKGTNVVVNFYATNSDGVPLSTATGITPYYRLNGGAKTTLVCNIYSLGTDAPGWFRFSTAQFNNSTGNLFITFSNSSNYIIMPWEDDIVPTGGSSAGDIWNYSFSGNNASSHLYNASVNAGSAYTAVDDIDIPTPPTTAAIAASVWTYSTQGNPASDRSLTYYPAVPNDYAKPGDEMALTAAAVTSAQAGLAKTTDIPTVPTAGDIATSVWGYTIGNPAASASTYLGSIGNIPQATWNYSWGTTVTSASVYLNSIYTNTSNIQTPPTAGAIAASVWNYSSAARGLTTSFYGTGTTSRFAVKDDIVATPGGITAADVWNYSIGNISAISFVQDISTNTNSISLNTGSIATSYATIAGSIGTNTADITSIKSSIGSINTSVGLVNAALLNWSVNGTTLTVTNGADITYSLSKDLAGNIIGVAPIE